MKYIYLLFLMFTIPAFAAQICGPAVTNLEYSYTLERPSAIIVGYWAVGMGCTNGETDDDINTSCENIVVFGHATCEDTNSMAVYIGAGSICRCWRTKLGLNGQLIDSPGFPVKMTYQIPGNETWCQSNCPRICAQEIVTNSSGLRNAIMTMPML